jgi:hypothetical protein
MYTFDEILDAGNDLNGLFHAERINKPFYDHVLD